MHQTKGQLAIILSKLKTFAKPKPSLEQYSIPSQIAASVLNEMKLIGDIDNKTIADLGAGTGILGLGASLLGAKKVFLVEIDSEALAVAKENKTCLEQDFGELYVEFANMPLCDFKQKVDVVIQNPPFGVQKEHADKLFLEKAFSLAEVVYSFHKEESEKFLSSFAKDNNFSITHKWFFEWLMKPTMRFHEKRKHVVRVGCWRFVCYHDLRAL